MDYEAIRSGLAQAVPFNGHLGLEVLEVGDGFAKVRLPDEDRLKNHVGSQHAGALFGAGEAASGAAVVGAFAEHLGSVTPLVKNAQIRFTKIALGPIVAAARIEEPVTSVLERLERDRRSDFAVRVELTNGEGAQVGELTVTWMVRKAS